MKAISLFSGMGGDTLGMKNAGEYIMLQILMKLIKPSLKHMNLIFQIVNLLEKVKEI